MNYAFPLHLASLETNYDSQERELLEARLPKDNPLSEYAHLLLLLWDKKYTEVINYSKTIWTNLKNADEKAFVLQVAVAACEMQFNQKERNELLSFWMNGPDLENNFYAQVIYFYHRGLTYFYSGALSEAKKNWQCGLKIATEIKYYRGQFRLTYHLGLILKEENVFKNAAIYFKESLRLAMKCKAYRFIERIETQLRGIEKNLNFYTIIEEQVFGSLKENRLNDSRRTILKACLLRRKEKRSWQAQSEYVLLALYCLSLNKIKSFEMILGKMADEHVHLHTLLLASTLFPSKEIIVSKIRKLNFILFPDGEKTPSGALPQINYNVPNLDDVKSFINLLRNNPEGVGKELICSEVWNLNYDPVLHENRIYKLIMNTRKYFGIKEAVQNRYGGKYVLKIIA
ncbi:MAG: hypothetical protein ACXVCP_05605 [Bdellovibrio sp.]